MTDTPTITPDEVSAAEITPDDMPVPTAPAPTTSTAQGATAAAEPHPPGPAGSTPAPAPTAGRWSGISAPRPGVDCDAGGTPYDPARHNPRLHKHSGRWMPRGGRKPAVAAAGTPPGAPAATAASRPPAPSFIPPEEPPAAATEEKPTGEAVRIVDHSTDAGEVIARGAQLTAGIVFDAPEDCQATDAEHRHMVEATAAWIRSKGWQAAAGVGVLLMFAAWLLKVLQRPKPQAKFRSWFSVGSEPSADAGAASAQGNGTPAPNGGAEIIHLPPGIPPLAR